MLQLEDTIPTDFNQDDTNWDKFIEGRIKDWRKFFEGSIDQAELEKKMDNLKNKGIE